MTASLHLDERLILCSSTAQLIMSARGPPKPNLVQIHLLGASGNMGEI